MMKTKIGLITAFTLLSVAVFAQNIDMERMNRDLEVAKDILHSLVGQNEGYVMWGRNIEASYLEDYGVIFTLPNNYVYSYGATGRAVIVDTDRRRERESEGRSSTEAEVVQEGLSRTRSSVETFLVDYATIIGQLDSDDRIMVHAKERDDVYISVFGEGESWSVREDGEHNFSAEIQAGVISDYKQGKISREQAIAKIEFKESEPKEKEQDLELFASIVKRLYSPDLSKTFFTSNTPNYERLEGFGVIFYMKTYSSYENDDLYRMPTLGRDDVSSEERKKTIEELYPQFEQDLKATVIEYGRTISSLQEDDVIMLKVVSTRCDQCSIPKSMN